MTYEKVLESLTTEYMKRLNENIEPGIRDANVKRDIELRKWHHAESVKIAKRYGRYKGKD